ncbi:unnamed protein product, partial [Heterosigma akashiwo]
MLFSVSHSPTEISFGLVADQSFEVTELATLNIARSAVLAGLSACVSSAPDAILSDSARSLVAIRTSFNAKASLLSISSTSIVLKPLLYCCSTCSKIISVACRCNDIGKIVVAAPESLPDMCQSGRSREGLDLVL